LGRAWGRAGVVSVTGILFVYNVRGVAAKRAVHARRFLSAVALDLRDSFTRRGGAARPINVLNPGLAHMHTAFIGRALFLSLRSSQKHCAGDRRVTGL
jgi:hypothetical protein